MILKLENALILIVLVGVPLVSLGCNQSMARRSLPAPLRDPVEVTLRGRVGRVWGGDNFEFGDYSELHYVLVRGIHSPAPGEPYFEDARQATFELTRGRRVIVEVQDRDIMMREVATINVPLKKGKPESEAWNDGPTAPNEEEYFDLGHRLIEMGWAEFDGTVFEQTQRYQDAEKKAKANGVGMWQRAK